MFSLRLLQAISDWQRGSADMATRTRRGNALKEAAVKLAPEFRRADAQCFRQIALDKESLWQLAVERELPEGISSWTTSLVVAERFKGGVPPIGDWQGVIWTVRPHAEQVVANLGLLFSDNRFRRACEEARKEISYYHDGIAKHSGTQHEVVLEMERLPLANVHAMGGYSSSKETMAKWFFGSADAAALAALENLLAQAGRELGPVWVTGDAKQRVLGNMVQLAEQLRRTCPPHA
ncbi:MAG TPA: hypothetical protein VHG32_00845 [Thermoanaerobaculia bacterium]|jgi:hypothetical protein|nr:hypothetical protein [Thermoanaerobaculia bacterium]